MTRNPLLSLALLASLASLNVAHAASLVVDSTLDEVDASPGDGICATAAATCTLRAAVMESNALPGQDDIFLDRDHYALTIPGSGGDAEGDLDLTDDVKIKGKGYRFTIIDGAPLVSIGQPDRIFEVASGVVARFRGVQLQQAKVEGATPASAVGGLMSVSGTARLRNVAFVDGRGGLGGALYVASTGEVRGRRVLFMSNQAYAGGAIYSEGFTRMNGAHMQFNEADGNAGGAIFTRGELIVRNSMLTENASTFMGGAIHVADGDARVVDSTLSDNTATTIGGAIQIMKDTAVIVRRSLLFANTAGRGGHIYTNGDLEIEESTLTGGSASLGGGAVYCLPYGFTGPTPSVYITDSAIDANYGSASAGLYLSGCEVDVENSTISNNHNSTGHMYDAAGAIVATDGAALTLTHVTITDNSLGGLSGGNSSAAGGIVNVGSTVVLANSILSGNAGAMVDCVGEITSWGGNVVSRCLMVHTATDQQVATAMLAPQVSSVTPGESHYPLTSGSPAVDAGDPANCLGNDQLGQTRDTACDAGAIEY